MDIKTMALHADARNRILQLISMRLKDLPQNTSH